jgi:hypothetical protein
MDNFLSANEALSQHLPGWTERNHKTPQYIDIWADVCFQNPTDVKQECYPINYVIHVIESFYIRLLNVV